MSDRRFGRRARDRRVVLDVYPSHDEIVRRAYELMVERGGDASEMFRRAEDELLDAAARLVCRTDRP